MPTSVDEEVFVTESGLVGMLTFPVVPDASRPVVIVLNSGLIHRVGAGRLSVRLARRIATEGYTTLRFDHAGVGDSAARRDGLDLDEGHIAEIVEAMDAVEEAVGSRTFVLFGLCSGARDAYFAALADSRVVGIAQIDGFSYRTPRYYLTKVKQRLTHPATLRRSVAARLDSSPSDSSMQGAVDLWAMEWPEFPSRVAAADGYRQLTERHVRFFVVFTGSWEDYYNYEGQFRDMYKGVDFDGLLTLEYLPHAAHVLPDPAHQRAVIDGVVAWLEEAWVSDPANAR